MTLTHPVSVSHMQLMKNSGSKSALVTGASRGFGYATASVLGAAGWHVIAVARTVGGLEDLADAVEGAGGAITLVPLDITDDGGLQRMARAIHDRWGRLDLMIHAAAQAAPCAPSALVAEKDFDACFAVNARATHRLVVMCDPLLKAADHGRAVYVADSRAGRANFSTYGASKAAGRAVIDSWRAEAAQIGPQVDIFEPRPMPTALRARFYPGENRDKLAAPGAEAARMIAELGLS